MERLPTDGPLDRRRFIKLAGTTGVVGTAGCIGDDEEPSDEFDDEREQSEGTDDASDASEEDEGDEEEDSTEFDFPPGTDENGLVKATVVSGIHQFLDETDRYRIQQEQTLNYSDAPRDKFDITYDVNGRTVYERVRRNGAEFDRWVTPEGTVGRSADSDTDKSGRWRSETSDRMDGSGDGYGYPLAETTVPALIESASFDFDEIVTEEEQPYARYTGEISDSDELEFRQQRSARIEYRPESVSAGQVSLLLAESGAVLTFECEFTAEASRHTHEGRERLTVEADSYVRFEYDGLEEQTTPEWVESNDVRSFGFSETSLGRTYRLVSGPSLPGTLETVFSEFYLMAEFDDDRYFATYTPRREFDDSAGVVAYLDEDEDELVMDWASMSGRDALAEADRIEMSVYLRVPEEGRTMVFHEERRL